MKTRRSVLRILALAVALGLLSSPSRAEESSKPGFIRFHKVARAEATLDTSVVEYRHPERDQVVALVGAVHIADASYFAQVQETLDAYDLVLYELVGDPKDDADPEAEAARMRLSFLGELQLEIKKLLEFSGQLECIDYRRKNLRHADLSAVQFNAELQRRGQSIIPNEALIRMAAPILLASLRMSQSMRSMDPQLTNRMRWQMGRLLSDVEKALGGLGLRNMDEEPDDVIIGVRNEHAYKVFQNACREGYRRLAIFYGAAHMPDFHRRLTADGWQVESTRWIPAWHIPVKSGEDEGSITPRRAREEEL